MAAPQWLTTKTPGSYESEQERIKRALAQAMALRQAGGQQPQGEMVGGQYVAPHWTERLAPVLQQVMGGYQERQAEEQAAGLSRRMQDDATAWMQNRPQERTVELPGPQPEGIEAPLTGQQAPTEQDQLNWMMQGQKNPLTKALAAKYGEDLLIEGPKREEVAKARAAESAIARAATAEQKNLDRVATAEKNRETLAVRLQELEGRMQVAGDNLELRRQLGEAANATRMALGELNANVRREGFANAKGIAEAKAEAAKAGAGNKPIPETVLKVMRGSYENMNNLNEVTTTFNDSFGGLKGAADALSGTWNPLAGQESKEAANWWKDYEQQAALTERHLKFGTALSESEQKAWRNATISKGMAPDAIRHNLETRSRIARNHYIKNRDVYGKAGYPSVLNAFEEAGAAEDFEPKAPTVVPPGPQISSPPGKDKVFNPATGRLE